ncbi:MAG: hypothetical protein LUE17_17985 [Planctomycetaceae bacterium]|nr:hypothetical protein [Planctomycetaceae bacterium]
MRTASFNRALFLDCLAVTTPPCLYGVRACLLQGKAVPVLAGTGVGIGCAALAAAWIATTVARFARQRRFTPDYALAWLDLHNRAGGRILAGEAAVARVVPSVSLRPFLKRLPLPLLFAVASLMVPPMHTKPGRARAAVDPVLDRLAEEVAVSEEAEALSAAEAEVLRRQIAEVRRLAETQPEAAMEALSSLPERLDAARAERLDAVADAMEKALDRAESLRRGEQDGGTGLSESMQQLAEASGGWEALPDELRHGVGATESMGGAPLDKLLVALDKYGETAAQNAAASRAANRNGESNAGASAAGAEAAAAERLASAREILDTMRMSPDGGMGAVSGLSGTGQTGGQGGAEGMDGDGPGSGGVSRGPGTAPLWIGTPAERGVEFEYRPLPPGDDSQAGALLRRERSLPDEAWREEAEAPGRSAVDAPAIVRGRGGRLAPGPSGEQAVTRYFDALRREEQR